VPIGVAYSVCISRYTNTIKTNNTKFASFNTSGYCSLSYYFTVVFCCVRLVLSSVHCFQPYLITLMVKIRIDASSFRPSAVKMVSTVVRETRTVHSMVVFCTLICERSTSAKIDTKDCIHRDAMISS